MESVLLVPVNLIKNKGYVNSNVEDNVIATTIVRFQETVLMPILGRDFYEYLIDAFKSNTLTPSDVTLLQDYISKCIIAGVDYRILVHLKTEVRANGLVQEAQQANKQDTTQLMNMNLKDANFYQDELQGYLCRNKTLYPKHGGKCTCNNKPRNTGINNFLII